MPVVEVVVPVVQIAPDEPSNIPFLSAVEMYHKPQSACANDDAPENIFSMLVTLDTSHLEMSALNDDASGTLFALNKLIISVTPDTSQDPIGPCGPSEQSKSPRFRHSAMAASSSALDLGAHPYVVVVVGIVVSVSISVREREYNCE